MSTASSSKRRQSCPLCGKSPAPDFTPFCSQGCRDRDLLNWLGDGYRMPGPAVDQGIGEIEADGLDSER